MLEKLTPGQEKQIEVTREKWLHRFFKDKSCDEQKIIDGIKWVYQLSGLKEPKVEFCGSPHAAQLRANELAGNKTFEFYAPGSYLSPSDFGWCAYYDYFTSIGILNDENFNRYRDLILAGFYDTIQLDEVCLVSRLPDVIKTDERDRLHCANGPAIAWADGYKQHYIHGVYFTTEDYSRVVANDMKFILALNNIEQRQAAMTILGAELILEHFDAKLIDKSARGNELYSISGIFEGDDELAYVLKYKDPSTSRIYVSFVPPEIAVKRCADTAIAARFGRTLEEYQALKIES